MVKRKDAINVVTLLLVFVTFSVVVSAQKDTEEKKLCQSINKFLEIWLVQKNVEQALEFISSQPVMSRCVVQPNVDSSNEGIVSRQLVIESLQPVFSQVVEKIEQPSELYELVESVKPWSSKFRIIDHPQTRCFSVSAIPKGKAAQLICPEDQTIFFKNGLKRPNLYLVTFTFKKGGANGGLMLIWASENGKWHIISLNSLNM